MNEPATKKDLLILFWALAALITGVSEFYLSCAVSLVFLFLAFND